MNLFNRKKILYSEMLDEWINTKNNVKLQTKQRYDNLIKIHIEPFFHNKEIKQLDINDFIHFIQAKNDEGVSVSVQKTLKYIMKASWEYGTLQKYCKPMIFDSIKFKKYTTEITVFSKEEQLILEKQLKRKINIRKVALLLCLYTGLRIGEVCGLKWENIDLTKRVLFIKRTIIRIKNNNPNINGKTILIESTPKSETSLREIPIPDFLIEVLRKFQSQDQFYILSNSEKLYDPRQLENTYSKIIKRCGIRYSKFHTLRHTFATRCIESKMDIKTLSEILGHASVDITLKIYVHTSTELKRTALQNLVQFMET